MSADSAPVRLLAISGSLRAASSNGSLVGAVALVAGPGVEVDRYGGLAALPHFNPDDDVEPPAPAVADLRARLRAADAVFISSPEYAHGVPGSLKNALDWVVGSGELMWKPVGLVNSSLSSRYVHAALAETLTVMMAELVPDACLPVPLGGRALDAAGIAADPELGAALSAIVAALVRAGREKRDQGAAAG